MENLYSFPQTRTPLSVLYIPVTDKGRILVAFPPSVIDKGRILGGSEDQHVLLMSSDQNCGIHTVRPTWGIDYHHFLVFSGF